MGSFLGTSATQGVLMGCPAYFRGRVAQACSARMELPAGRAFLLEVSWPSLPRPLIAWGKRWRRQEFKGLRGCEVRRRGGKEASRHVGAAWCAAAPRPGLDHPGYVAGGQKWIVPSRTRAGATARERVGLRRAASAGGPGRLDPPRARIRPWIVPSGKFAQRGSARGPPGA
jgi:hypothetical protein